MGVDLVVMLLASLLLLATGDDGPSTAQLVLQGEHVAATSTQALLVTDGAVTVPAGVRLDGPLHVLGGRTDVAGTVDGDVVVLAGTLALGDTAEVTGTLRHVGGELQVAPGAEVARTTTLATSTAERDPVQRAAPTVLLAAVLAALGGVAARRRPAALAVVSSAVADHPVISLTVGAFVAVTSLSVLVFMALTLVLVPVSLLGLAVGLLAVAYGVVATGHLIGRRLPVPGVGRSTAAGVLVVVLLLAVLGLVPVVGDLASLGVLLTGLGAVLLTYLGLQRFEPVTLPDEGQGS